MFKQMPHSLVIHSISIVERVSTFTLDIIVAIDSYIERTFEQFLVLQIICIDVICTNVIKSLVILIIDLTYESLDSLGISLRCAETTK